jgi:PAS domain S-box-containing protein
MGAGPAERGEVPMSASQMASMGSGDATSLDDFFENGTVGLHLVSGDGTILRANRADFEPLGYSAEEYVGRHIAEFHADRDTIEDILGRLTRGEKLDKYPARLRAKDGSIRHVQISSSVCFRDGQFLNTRCFTVDVTDKIAAERALREAQERLAATYESVLAGIAEVDSEGRFLRVNEGFCRITGFSREELQKRSFFDLTHPDDLQADRERFERQATGDLDRYSAEKRYVRKDGRIVWIEVISSTVSGPDGGFGYGVRMILDISERKDWERKQRLLLDELNHRVKNTLATVQSLVSHTARSCSTAAEFRVRFEPRLMALSSAHDRLTRNQWQGASLADIATEELAAHAGDGRTLDAQGPEVHLPPKTSLSLSMALHELATNAAKHGALSAAGGRVEIAWQIEPGGGQEPPMLALSWSESGGPDVQPPSGTGFGSRLLRVTAEELGGHAETEFARSGLQWRIRFPLEAQESSAA